jgi:hypothetical protein
MNLLITLLGGYVVGDGIVSIYKYRYQSLKEHAARVIRSAIGIIFTYLGILL